ncbi:error-prone DNA polymerase [Lignipirellula cremea]|uniref:Error-prone DNA polymerase n=1 Tax=Lignipirellula cremea TaxID=2528010 RepID=A0A518DYQ1_9BACT|nr:error-prone DNA polymerase [Lignipirellula cremea]QDU96968.1 Error-prone DNA polymerase [Lignipirellula cremea]
MHYAELHCKTNFSFLEGASHAAELAEKAHALGYQALAVTDVNSLAGVVRAHMAAKDLGLKLLIGAEIVPQEGPRLLLWATNRAAYARLARLITVGRRRAPKGQCLLTIDDVAQHAQGLIAGLVPPPQLLDGPEALQQAVDHAAQVREIFPGRTYQLGEISCGPNDRRRLAEAAAIARQAGVPLVAAGDVHYHSPSRLPLHDVLTAIRHGVPITEAGEQLFPNAQRHLKPLPEIERAFADYPEAVARTLEIADRCNFSLDELRYEYPEELAPPGLTPYQHLSDLAWRGAKKRYPQGVPRKVHAMIEHELQLIQELRYEAYFLTVWDLVRFARSRGILCQGRGSAANSAVCFCLGVTSVDPVRCDLLFERFVSRERDEAPDIDIDFEHERREEVLQYLYEKYGRERAGMTAVVITYRIRSAVRDVGKALGLSLDRIDSLAKSVEGRGEENLAQRFAAAGFDPTTDLGQRLIYLATELLGFPRHLSQHVGGMVITQGPLCELAPIENAAMDGRTVIEWDKDDLDELGILKVDCLSLGMLAAIRKSFTKIQQHYGRSLSLASIPEGDPKVYDMICKADTIGVFQIESRAQMNMLPRLRPRCFYDLVIEVAIVRPGPIQGDMVHPYLRRRAGEETPIYPNEAIREVLHKTLGVPLFQEQAMRLAVVAAGFTPGEADQLRRAMGAWRRPGVIDQFRHKLLAGMQERGLTEKFAMLVFDQIRGFGEYGFPESHAASFALLTYVSAWLKRYYPAVLTASILNSLPMGFYGPAQLVRDVRKAGVEVRPVDVNFSDWDCTLEERSSPGGRRQGEADRYALRLGLRMISGLRKAAGAAIETARQAGPFASVCDLKRRTRLSRTAVSTLAAADALASLCGNRRTALWEALALDDEERPLFALLADNEPPAALPRAGLQEETLTDYVTTGLSLKAHPISFCRRELDRLSVAPAEQLAFVANGRFIRTAGLVLLRQRPSTAKGITFVTLEDETGVSNLIIKQAVWEQFYTIARRSQAWIVEGKLECKHDVVNIVVSKIQDLTHRLRDVRFRSRDFQ